MGLAISLLVPSHAQELSSTAQQQSDPPAAQTLPGTDTEGQQTKRILGILPNFRAVSVGTELPPQSVKDKFLGATQDSFDYSSVFLPAAIAAYDMGRDADPEFHQGGPGYARYLWHSAVDQTSENYMVEFVFPVITREDTRYYTLGSGGFKRRAGYALSRAFITRNNAGDEVFNVSEVVGAGAAAGLSNLYYPSRDRTVSNTVDQLGLDVAIDAASFTLREFWPDINRKVFHGKQPQ